MKNAKKNISSLWKATKERLSGTVTKRRKEKERNLQSTVKAKRYLSSRPAKETNRDIDAEILEELGKITFTFGDKTPTVEEAGLLFVYEVKLDLFQVYVIALSEKYGTIIFYLPEELTEKIADRVAELAISFDNYLYNLVEYGADIMHLNSALAISGYTVAEAVKALLAASKMMFEEVSKPIDVRIRSNNWLKLHGYPMRRKKGRRKHE